MPFFYPNKGQFAAVLLNFTEALASFHRIPLDQNYIIIIIIIIILNSYEKKQCYYFPLRQHKCSSKTYHFVLEHNRNT